MTRVFITIDTEYSSGLYTGPGAADRADNFARSIACETPEGPAGIPRKLAVLARHGQKAVFFVDPMPRWCGGLWRSRILLPDDAAARRAMLEAAEDDRMRAFLLHARSAAVAYLSLPVSGRALIYSHLGYDPA